MTADQNHIDDKTQGVTRQTRHTRACRNSETRAAETTQMWHLRVCYLQYSEEGRGVEWAMCGGELAQRDGQGRGNTPDMRAASCCLQYTDLQFEGKL